jgi:hypothetical protein
MSYLQASAHPLHLIYSASQSTTSNGDANSWYPHHHHPSRCSPKTVQFIIYRMHPTNRLTTEINLISERMLTGAERFLADCSIKDQLGASAMEGRLAFGCEIWLRDVGTAKSGLVLERWWVDHRLPRGWL